ncbi:retrotransposon protein, putative, ty1-copia subclass [Tanacetum coccineum]
MTPYEIWHRKAPKLSYLRVWGCEALVKQETHDKLDSKSIKCIFVSYPKETIGYYFYYPLKNKIFVSRNAEFFENSFMVQEASKGHKLLEMSGSDKGLEIIQEEDTQPSENTSNEHNEVAPIEVFSIWKAFGGNTRDLGSFGEETDKTTDQHQHFSGLCSQRLETASQDARDAVKIHPMMVSQESMTASARTIQPKI